MSDLPPPPVPPEPSAPPVPPGGASAVTASDASDDDRSLWGRYRTLPLWAQILIPLVIVAVLIGLVVLLTSTGGDESSSADTTIVDDANLDVVLRGIIIAGGIRGDDATATTVPATTEQATTVPATTESATTEPTVSEAPDTTAKAAIPDTTVAEQPTTSESAPTTTDESAPTTTEVVTGGLPSPDDFLAQWNTAADGTDVPEITRDQITEIVDGPFAGAFLATLTPNVDDPEEPQVGLIGTMSTTDPTQIAELLLVYIDGPDESASDFYWEAFRVLTLAVDPATTDEEIADLEDELGREEGLPPFPEGTDNVATSNGFTFNLYTGTTPDDTPATGIAVT